MFNTTAVKNNVKKRDIAQLNSIIETSSTNGMISFSKYAERLRENDLIDEMAYEKMTKKKL